MRDTAITFEVEPPDADELARRIGAAHAWLVLLDRDRVIGFASVAPWKSRAAYAWSCETGIYLDGAVTGRGGGRLLLDAALERARDLGFRTAVAGIAHHANQPNPASEALHRAVGFREAGTLRRVGFKQGMWWDVTYYDLVLAEADPDVMPGSAR